MKVRLPSPGERARLWNLKWQFLRKHPAKARYHKYKQGTRGIVVRNFVRSLPELATATEAELRWWTFWVDALVANPSSRFQETGTNPLSFSLKNRFMHEFSYFFDAGWGEALARSGEIETQLLAWIPEQPEMLERPAVEQLWWAGRVHFLIMRYLTA